MSLKSKWVFSIEAHQTISCCWSQKPTDAEILKYLIFIVDFFAHETSLFRQISAAVKRTCEMEVNIMYNQTLKKNHNKLIQYN